MRKPRSSTQQSSARQMLTKSDRSRYSKVTSLFLQEPDLHRRSHSMGNNGGRAQTVGEDARAFSTGFKHKRPSASKGLRRTPAAKGS